MWPGTIIPVGPQPLATLAWPQRVRRSGAAAGCGLWTTGIIVVPTYLRDVVSRCSPPACQNAEVLRAECAGYCANGGSRCSQLAHAIELGRANRAIAS